MMSRNHYTLDEDRRLKAMWKAGDQIKIIARALGRTPGSVEHRTWALGLPRRVGVPVFWKEERNSQLAELWAQGLPILEICDRMNVGFDGLRRHIDKLRKSHPGLLPHRRANKKAA